MSQEPNYKAEPSYELLDSLRLIPLFYTINWTPDKKSEWLRITGATESTTKVLCDHISSAISVLESKPKLPGHPDDIVHYCLRGVRGAVTDDQYIDASSRIREAIQNAFDLGFTAAGGGIFPLNDKETP